MKFLRSIKDGEIFSKKFNELESFYKKRRETVRFILFDKNNNIALNHRPANEEEGFPTPQASIPGGGIEKTDGSLIEALKREALEETGCKIKDIKEIGYILEYIKEHDLIQKGYCFTCKVDGEKEKPQLTKFEKETKLNVVWLPYKEARKAAENMIENYAKTRSLLIMDEVFGSLKS